MPEGPSIIILKEQVQQFCGKKVIDVTGNSKEKISLALGKNILDFKTWGKHFLICFPDFTIRIHPLLFGSYRINEGKVLTPRLSLTFDNGCINFYSCSLKLIYEPLDSIYDWSADIMSPEWDEKAALKKLLSKGNSLLCDVLLDQNMFAGSGNIIKNEVLFRQKLHPLNTIAAIPTAQLILLIKDMRQYAFDFLRWKKAFVLRKHWQAYAQKTCPRCSLPLIKAPLGNSLRRTFYCENCQQLF